MTVFKYGGSSQGKTDDVVVYYWSETDKNFDNTSRQHLEQHRRPNVTAELQQQHMQVLDTASVTGTSVHSAALVLTIAGQLCKSRILEICEMLKLEINLRKLKILHIIIVHKTLYRSCS